MTLQLLINGTDYTPKWRVYEARWSSKAWLAESVQAEFIIDDFNGAVSHDDLKPHKIVEVWEDASGSPLCLYRGRIANKTLGMGAAHYRIAMQWHVLTEDSNIDLRGLRVESQNRGLETDDERVEFFRLGWLNGVASTNSNARASTVIGGAYIGTTPANAVDLDEELYVDTFPAEVLQRIAEQSGRQVFVYLEDDGSLELFYDNRGSQQIVADIDITDDGETDGADGVDLFAAYRTPNAGDHAGQDVYTGGAIRYGDAGTYYEVSDVGGVESEYDKWETTWSNDWVETEHQAGVILGRIITNHDETISYVATIDMKPEDAHRIKAGMWIPSVRLRRANKNGTDGIRAVVVTHEPVKPNADGESLYRVTIEMGRPQFVGPMVRGRRRIPRGPTQPTPDACTRLYLSDDGSAIAALDPHSGWANPAFNTGDRTLKFAPDNTQNGGNGFAGVNVAVSNQRQRGFTIPLTNAGLLAVIQSGGEVHGQLRGRSRYGAGISESAQNNIANMSMRVFTPGGGGTYTDILDPHTASSGTKFPAQATAVNRTYGPWTFDAMPGAASTDYLYVEFGSRHLAPITGGTGATAIFTDTNADDLPEDELETAAFNSWIDICTTGGSGGSETEPVGGGGSGTPGTSTVYAPIDHVHEHGILDPDDVHMHSDSQLHQQHTNEGSAPTVTDDADAGYKRGWTWNDTSTGDVYFLVDSTPGAAVWVGIGGDRVGVNFVIDGGGSTITTGVKGDVRIPFAATIESATLLADQSGAIVVDVWKDTYANFPPVVGDKITASAPPTITASGVKSEDTTLTGWTTAIAAGDTLRFNVNSVTSIQRVTLILKIRRT